jgi:transcriptional regulator with XRE-family HTH domain
MLTLDQIAGMLQDRRLDKVHEATGVHPNTLRAIRKGRRLNPSYNTLKALSEYLGGAEK